MAQVIFVEGQPMPVVPPVRGRNWHVKPCGTSAAYRRHLRRGEPLDDSCRQAESLRIAIYRERVAARGAKFGGRWPRDKFIWRAGDVIPSWGNRPLNETEAAYLNRAISQTAETGV